METSEFGRCYEAEISKRSDERFRCWVRIYEVNARGGRLSDWPVEAAYCMTEFTGLIWARHVIKQLKRKHRDRKEDRAKKFIVDSNAKSKKDRDWDSWLIRTFTR